MKIGLNMNTQHIFIVGSKGIPAKYGGFETFVDKLTEYRKSKDIVYHVACKAKDTKKFMYNNAYCYDINVPNIGAAQAIVYDLLALQYAISYCKKHKEIEKPIFYILACRIGPFMKYFTRRIHFLGGKVYVNPDGHEWKRAKWNYLVRKYWKLSEKLMVKDTDLLICDSKNIEKYIHEDYAKYDPQTTFIAYGAEVEKSKLSDSSKEYVDWLSEHKVKPNNYYLIVGRFVPENNFETMIKEFRRSSTNKDLVIITTPNESLYQQLEQKYDIRQDARIKFVGTVYNQELLKKIRENAYGYFHGHEVGGTNPSLLEALGSTQLTLALKVGFNEEVCQDAAVYWTKEEGNLSAVIEKMDSVNATELREYAAKARNRILSEYNWDYIVEKYENCFLDK